MGLINYIKTRIEMAKQIKEIAREFQNALKEQDAEFERFKSLSSEELSSLPENKLLSAVYARTEHIMNEFDDILDGYNSLNQFQKIYYAINYYDMEVQNGGLCQFFANSSRAVAPFISGCLETIGAFEHKKLYDDFVEQNRIDLTDLSSFDVEDMSEYQKQTERYPFDVFDNAFYDLPPLEGYLLEYVKQNISEF